MYPKMYRTPVSLPLSFGIFSKISRFVNVVLLSESINGNEAEKWTARIYNLRAASIYPTSNFDFWPKKCDPGPLCAGTNRSM